MVINPELEKRVKALLLETAICFLTLYLGKVRMYDKLHLTPDFIILKSRAEVLKIDALNN